jgi:hypothetical protein
MRSRAVLAAALALLAATEAAAQQENACHLVQDRLVNTVGQEPNRVGYVSGPLLVTCDRGEQLRSDSAVVYEGQHEVQLFGRVDYQDPTRALTSDYATYNSQTGRLYARGSVVFTDRERGSTLRGPELEYFRQMAGRPDAQMIAPGRPHLTLVPRQDPGKPRRDPMDVDGDRITTVGNRFMSAEGNVVIRGKDLNARSAEAFYDADQDRLELRRTASIEGPRYTLRGDFIETTMKEGKVQRVLARTDAHLVSDKLNVDGPLLTLFFADDKLQRLVAAPQRTAGVAGAAVAAAPPTTSPAAGATTAPGAPAAAAAADSAEAAPRPATAATGPRPVATATGFRLQADSLEALLPNQQLREVYAIGRAHGESWDTATAGPDGTRKVTRPAYRPPPVDTAAARRASQRRPGAGAEEGNRPAPDSAAVAAALARVPSDRDVVDADTIIGHFIQVDTARARPVAGAGPVRRPGAAADTAKPEPKTELDRMQAFGGAHALYRLKPKQDTTRRDTASVGQPGINYVIGDTIDLKMANGEVQTAHVRGLERGVYLEPQQPARDTAAAAPQPGTAAAPAPGTARANPAPPTPLGRPATPVPTTPAPTPPPSQRREDR